jgi:hypothetical protein
MTNSDIRKEVLIGSVGGLLGALAMSGFAGFRHRLARKRGHVSRSELTHLEASRYVDGSSLELDSIALAADRLDRLSGHRMSPRQKSLAAAGVHFGMGAVLGGVYGAAAARTTNATRGFGVPFAVAEAVGGNTAWTAATKSMNHYSLWDQAASVADHAVFGMVVEATRRVLRKAG